MSLETDRIEADLNASRHRLNDTLEALGEKLSPGQMLDEVLGLAQGQAGQFAAKLGRQVRDNPMPTLLIGAGVAMLLLNHQRQDGAPAASSEDWSSDRRFRSIEEARWSTTRLAGEAEEAFNERLHAAHAKALDLKQAAGEAIGDFKTRVAHAVAAVEHGAVEARARLAHAFSDVANYTQRQAANIGHKAAEARRGAEHFYEDSPLAVGAIALAVGAIVGSLTPLSPQEREGLSGVADNAVRASADLAERGAKIVEDSVEAAIH